MNSQKRKVKGSIFLCVALSPTATSSAVKRDDNHVIFALLLRLLSNPLSSWFVAPQSRVVANRALFCHFSALFLALGIFIFLCYALYAPISNRRYFIYTYICICTYVWVCALNSCLVYTCYHSFTSFLCHHFAFWLSSARDFISVIKKYTPAFLSHR